MNKIAKIKKYTNWANVIEIPYYKYRVIYNPTINVHEEISQIKAIYSSESLDDYIIVQDLNFFYIGNINENKIVCFAKCDSLKEACESL